MIRQVRPAIAVLITLMILTGIIYPALVTGMAQLLFPQQANGSLMMRDGKVIGSHLIGQHFEDIQYFWGRPSATSGTAYNASASGGSNYSVLNPELQKRIESSLAVLQNADPQINQPVPVDLVTSSGSGLDPHISVASAQYQAARVARARGLDIEQVNSLITEHTRERLFGVLGEKTVNVLELNISLDTIQ